MIVLDSNYSLVCVLSAAKTTTDMDFVISFASSSTSAFTESIVTGVTNGTTEVEMVAAPAAGTTKVIKSISIFNSDTATKTLTIKVKTGGTLRLIVKSDIAPNDTLTMGNDGQWKIFTNSYQEYGYLTLSAAQTTDLLDTNPVKFNTLSAGNIQTDLVNYHVILRAGITYLLQCSINALFSGVTGRVFYQFYDLTNATLLGSTACQVTSTYNVTNLSAMESLKWIITPAAAMDVRVNIVSPTALTSFYQRGYFLVNSLY